MKLKRRLKYYLIRLLRIKASSSQVAYGLMLGFIPNWIPTFGIGPILSIGITKLFRGNILAAIVGGVIGAPLWPLLFYLNYTMGSFLLVKKSEVGNVEEIAYLDTVNETVSSFQSGSLLFLTGAMINILLSSILIYILVYILLKKYRELILRKIR